jgi:succinoglycan biosynthesis protein ExoA
MDGLPFVSIIVPMRNEERYIARCLDSILLGDYPYQRLEVLVVDGESTDFSPEIVCDYGQRFPFVKLLKNHKRVTPAALNIGIREARGDVIVWMGAHATYSPNYVRQSVRLLEEARAADVGGRLCCVGEGYVGNAIAAAVKSRFGIGDARYRYSDQEAWVDTVFGGCWQKATLEALGGFDEDAITNQDYEINFRLRKAGGRILYSPSISAEYYVRRSIRGLARQYLRYGCWKVRTLVKHPDSLRWRQLVPPAFVLGLVISLLLAALDWRLAAVLPSGYVAVNVISSVLVAAQRGWHLLPMLPIVFATLHLSFGLGFWGGLTKFGVPRFSLRGMVRSFRSKC